MFKPGDEVIAIRDSPHGLYKTGNIFIIKSVEPLSIFDKDEIRLNFNNTIPRAFAKNFITKKEHDFNNNMKDLLK